MFKVSSLSDKDDCIFWRTGSLFQTVCFVLLNKPCVLDVALIFWDVCCQPFLIWEYFSNLRGTLFLYKNISYKALKAHKGETHVMLSAEVSFLQHRTVRTPHRFIV